MGYFSRTRFCYEKCKLLWDNGWSRIMESPLSRKEIYKYLYRDVRIDKVYSRFAVDIGY